KDGSGSFFCGQCGRHSAIDYLMQMHGWDFAHAAKEIEDVLGEVKFNPAGAKSCDSKARSAMQRLWDQGRSIQRGDFVDLWFSGRGVGQETYSRWMRKVERCEYVDDDGRKSWHPA